MIKYIIRRVLAAIPVLFGVLVVIFILVRLIPGDPCTAMLGEKATAASCEVFNREMGFDQPIPIQFGIYARDILRGDLGDSIRFKRPITQILVERLPVTIELGISALFVATLIGIPAGLTAAIRRNSTVDVGMMVGANIGVSMPVFWLGLMLAYVFALLLRDTPFWLPPSGRLPAGMVPTPFYEVYGWEVAPGSALFYLFEFLSNLYIFNALITADWDVLWQTIRHLILPAVALATIPMAIIARMTRSSMLEVLGRDYVRTARAKGLADQVVIIGHAFRNALLPVVTIVGLQLGTVFGGAVLTETIFNLAGVGRILFEAITARDYPIIQGVTLVVAILYVAINLLVDVSYALLDPRIRLD